MKTLGCADLDGADDKKLAKAAFRHPLNARIIELIRGVPKSDNPELAGVRALRKIKSTYLRTDADITKTSKGGAKEFNGVILSSLIPHGTDSDGLLVESTISGVDFSCRICLPASLLQHSKRQMAFTLGNQILNRPKLVSSITGDPKLIEAVNSDRDFHSLNTSAFLEWHTKPCTMTNLNESLIKHLEILLSE